ncbi:DUF1810 domain-containing protein [Frigidibacter sp. MR17.24]|uniref:DUF1810 domain-containing protein n=1 Tax=Frigidibacter sp. MR17.24 TaxID=3127345 RepID=UPI0030131923
MAEAAGAARDLARFHAAQARQYADALAELRAGRKTSHWIWFVFPQLRALGRSGTARFYGIEDLAEAQAYLADPVLSARLAEAAGAVLDHAGTAVETIMGSSVDALKLRSSATLFAHAGPATPAGAAMLSLLQRFWAGAGDPLTRDLLA